MSPDTEWNEDCLLDLLGNHTRRRMLRLLADEPRYFIQLARDVGVSQQAVLKHLDLLEGSGLVNSYRARSDLSGPDRKYFRLNRSILLTIGMTGDTFRIKLNDLERPDAEDVKIEGFESECQDIESGDDISDIVLTSKDLIQKIDSELGELDEKRASLLRLRQKVMSRVHGAIRESFEESLARRILYWSLDYGKPVDVESLSEELDAREKEIRQSLKELERRLHISF